MESISNCAFGPSCGNKRAPPPSTSPPVPASHSTTFLVQTPHGLEHVAIEEMRTAFSSHVQAIRLLPHSNGIIILQVDLPPCPSLGRTVTQMACADTAALHCAEYAGLALDNTAIDKLKDGARSIAWGATWTDAYAALLPHQPQQPHTPTFRCTCSRTTQMSDWGYNDSLPPSSRSSPPQPPDPSRVFARFSDAAASQAMAHVSTGVFHLSISCVWQRYSLKCSRSRRRKWRERSVVPLRRLLGGRCVFAFIAGSSAI